MERNTKIVAGAAGVGGSVWVLHLLFHVGIVSIVDHDWKPPPPPPPVPAEELVRAYEGFYRFSRFTAIRTLTPEERQEFARRINRIRARPMGLEGGEDAVFRIRSDITTRLYGDAAKELLASDPALVFPVLYPPSRGRR